MKSYPNDQILDAYNGVTFIRDILTHEQIKGDNDGTAPIRCGIDAPHWERLMRTDWEWDWELPSNID